MIQKLIVPLDGSGFGEEALRYAATIARHTDADVELTHVHVPHPPDHLLANTQYQFEGIDLEEYDLRDRSEEEAYLKSAAKQVEEKSGRETRTVLLMGMVADAIDGYARGSGPGLIVMSTHGRSGLSRAWLGSVAEAVVRHAPWPVLLVRPGESAESNGRGGVAVEMRHIVVPLDGSERSGRIVEPAAELAGALGSSVRLLQVITPNTVLGTRVLPVSLAAINEARRRAAEYLDGIAERFRDQGIAVETEVLDDPQPALAILEVVERDKAAMVALATHGYRGIRRAILGSVADKVLRGADVPVLLLGPGVEA